MSNIYIQEPPTSGKVLLVTTVGEIDIELWCKEAPRACRNFIQLCMEGYYNGLIFHRVVREFIVQGGDPTGTGQGGDSIWGKPFKDEFHSRLRFNRRGLMAMANAGPNDNGSQFFFTLAAAPELNNKHTIFGKVAGNTIYNMIKLEDCDIGEDERPLYPHKIIRTKILASPFDDILPRVLSTKKDKGDETHKKKSTAKATKNFALLSFGEEAEEDEEEVDKASQSMRGKSKSSHDLLDDEKLSALPAIHPEKRKTDHYHQSDEDEPKSKESESVKKKLKLSEEKKERDKKERPDVSDKGHDEDGHQAKALDKLEDLKKQQEALKREILGQKEKDTTLEERKPDSDPDDVKSDDNDMVVAFKAERKAFKKKKKQLKPKGTEREQQTLAILKQFKSKMNAAQKLREEAEEEGEEERLKDEKEEEEDDAKGLTDWLGYKLEFDDREGKVLDANMEDADRYEIYDPRNPLTKRRREVNKQGPKSKSRDP